ncbi:MAG: hypothetical protein L3K26_19965, partial [Candidatus Hydrogenedentes bacterium]|nr:hypothetical protein [Candidatus Hydrogenedentota bacterium]
MKCRIALFVLLSVCSIQAFAEDTARFVQDRFAIGLWVDPPLDDKAPARYQELADANFTVVIGGFGRGDVAQQVALCERHDLKLIVSSRGKNVTDLPDAPSLWGYALRDEPSATDFPALREASDAIAKNRPGKLRYMNLFPNYANPSQLGTETYEEHVRQFIKVVDPDVLSMDHYPIFRPGRDGRAGYCKNLATFRTHSLAAEIPFWNFFNTMPYGPHTDPTEGQLRWQIYTSLAYGAKGVLYFCYYTPAGKEFPKGGAIIRRDGRRTRHYDEAQRINLGLKHLGPTLMQLTSTAVVRISESDGDRAAEKLKGLPIINIARGKVDPPMDYLVGAFTHEDGRRAVLLNNYRFAYTAWPTVTFDAPSKSVLEGDQRTGDSRP